ncbi:MAG: DUF4238 domain-containing protein, partial [Acidobacteriota bacterium]|nr:DUF4238 domain-containing protein [Acidobacteriota bacterium]
MTPPKAPKQNERNRWDHILPRGYLAGFAKPSTPGKIAVLDVERQRWFEAKTKNSAAARGYYDYSEDSTPDTTADDVFSDFEKRFPSLIRGLVADNFSDWSQHREFLISYAQ